MRTARSMRRAAAAASLALVASLTACGGDSGGGSGSSAPDNASLDDFCTAFNGLFDTVMAQATSGGADASGMIAALKKWAADIEDVGTPADMPDDARHGFELFVDQAKKLPDDATLQDLENLGQDLSSGDQADGEAFSAWTTKNCPLDLPSGLPSNLPSVDPSDLPSIDPSDLPSMDPSDLESMMSELSELTQSP